jgi:hypothetical protein
VRASQNTERANFQAIIATTHVDPRELPPSKQPQQRPFSPSKCRIPSNHGLHSTALDFFRVDLAKIRRDLAVAHQSVIMRPQANGRIVRIKKLSRSAGQQILREDQIDSTEYDSLQDQYKVETGVEKSEESVCTT